MCLPNSEWIAECQKSIPMRAPSVKRPPMFVGFVMFMFLMVSVFSASVKAEERPIPLNAEARKTLGRMAAYLDHHIDASEIGRLEDLTVDPDDRVRALSTILLFRAGKSAYEDDVVRTFSVNDYVARSKDIYNIVEFEEVLKVVKAVEEQNKEVQDKRLVLLMSFFQFKDSNIWFYNKKQKLSAARFFRAAFLASVLKGTDIDSVELSNRIDRLTESRALGLHKN